MTLYWARLYVGEYIELTIWRNGTVVVHTTDAPVIPFCTSFNVFPMGLGISWSDSLLYVKLCRWGPGLVLYKCEVLAILQFSLCI